MDDRLAESPAVTGGGRARVWGRLLAAIAALVAFSFAFQWSRGLWEPDEGRHTICCGATCS